MVPVVCSSVCKLVWQSSDVILLLLKYFDLQLFSLATFCTLVNLTSDTGEFYFMVENFRKYRQIMLD